MRSFLFVLLVALFSINTIEAQTTSFFKPANDAERNLTSDQERRIVPEKYSAFSCDLEALRTYMESNKVSRFDTDRGTTLSLPMPDGTHVDFDFKVNPTMQPGIAARYPMINSFVGRSPSDPTLRAYIDYTYSGFHAVIYGLNKRYYIDPMATNQTDNYIVYDFKDYSISDERSASFTCGLNEELIKIDESNFPIGDVTFEDETALEVRSNDIITYREYDLALATTGEYSSWHGGTLESVMSAVVTAINRVNSILENEHAIHMTLIDETDEIFFLNSSTDPYTNGDTQAMINENPTAIGFFIDANKYDMGHVLGTNAGGLAQLSSVCTGGKARGVTCHGNPIGDGFYVDYICHEMGHQFSGNHVMNQCNGNNESSGNAYEPGSGSTIMSYSGLCGSNNITFDSGPYYNVHTVSEFKNFTHNAAGSVCPDNTITTNRSPEVIIPWEGGFYIPISTPFELTGTANDLDGDLLYYTWEQHDLGPSSPLGNPAGTAPLFRSYNPDTIPTRIFPKAFTILTNQSSVVEVLPSYSRELTFRLTARDYNPQGGATDWAEVAFEATETAGPFLVTYPNSLGLTWRVGEYREVTWDVANTDNDLVNCQYVDIFLSDDNGMTFPDTVVTNVRNDGSHFITVPDYLTTKARIKIKAHSNKFFDISNAKFTIAAALEPTAVLTVFPDYQDECLPGMASVDFIVDAVDGFNEAVTFEVFEGMPANATYNFSPSSASPGEQVTLSIDMTDVEEDGLKTVGFYGITASMDTLIRYTDIDLKRSDFSDIVNMAPMNNAHDLSLAQNYDWATGQDASKYRFQLSSHPSFYENFILLDINDLTESKWDNPNLLEPNTVYYWRVAGINDCGQGPWRASTAFKTEAVQCNVTNKMEDIFIPSGSANVKESIINIPSGGTIQDVNIPIVRGLHSSVSDLRVDVISPSGTEVLLWKYKCGTGSNFNLGFDDESLAGVTCPLTTENIHIPEGSLSDFDGQSVTGDWILRVTDSNISNGGSFKEWEIEFCSSLAGQEPQLITNETMFIHPLDELFVGTYHLETVDEASNANQLTYTLIEAPQNGKLTAFGFELSQFSEFLQGTIGLFELKYEHTEASSTTDSFRFEVRDHEGGWIGIYDFNIVVDANAVYTDVETVNDVKELKLYPSPTKGNVNVEIDELSGSDVVFAIYDIQGRLVHTNSVDNFNGSTVLDLGGLNDGTYLVKATSDQFVAQQKLVIIK